MPYKKPKPSGGNAVIFRHFGVARPRRGGGVGFLDVDDTELVLFGLSCVDVQKYGIPKSPHRAAPFIQ
jgi:hypothetical protein